MTKKELEERLETIELYVRAIDEENQRLRQELADALTIIGLTPIDIR